MANYKISENGKKFLDFCVALDRECEGLSTSISAIYPERVAENMFSILVDKASEVKEIVMLFLSDNARMKIQKDCMREETIEI